MALGLFQQRPQERRSADEHRHLLRLDHLRNRRVSSGLGVVTIRQPRRMGYHRVAVKPKLWKMGRPRQDGLLLGQDTGGGDLRTVAEEVAMGKRHPFGLAHGAAREQQTYLLPIAHHGQVEQRGDQPAWQQPGRDEPLEDAGLARRPGSRSGDRASFPARES